MPYGDTHFVSVALFGYSKGEPCMLLTQDERGLLNTPGGKIHDKDQLHTACEKFKQKVGHDMEHVSEGVFIFSKGGTMVFVRQLKNRTFESLISQTPPSKHYKLLVSPVDCVLSCMCFGGFRRCSSEATKEAIRRYKTLLFETRHM